MCLGSIELLTEAWDDAGARVGRTQSGAVLSLAFAPEAAAGSHVLLYAGCAVEVLDPRAVEEALELRAEAEAAGA